MIIDVFAPTLQYNHDYTLIFLKFIILPFYSQINMTLLLFNVTFLMFWWLTRGKIAWTCEQQGKNHKVKENEGTITISM